MPNLNIEIYYGSRVPWSNSIILESERSLMLIDTQFLRADAAEVVKELQKYDKPLKTILLTHSHPDHVFGGAEILKAFPQARVYARPPVVLEINTEFHARRLRWLEMLGDQLPRDIYPIEELKGDTIDFDGHQIDIIDLKPAETVHATAFYLPESKTYIAGDQLYHKCHFYIGGGLHRPDWWKASIEDTRAKLDIDTIIPGHGSIGGTDIMDRAMDYLSDYEQVATPDTTVPQILDAMMEKYPDYHMEGVLYMTREPGITSPELLRRTGGKLSFGEGKVVD